MQTRFRLPFTACLVVASVAFQGCLATWMRLEDGTVLRPGRSELTLAGGKVPRTEWVCPDPDAWLERTSEGQLRCAHATAHESWGRIDSAKTFQTSAPSDSTSMEEHFGLAWRLGAMGPFGPFTGLELGLQMEVPTAPASQEFRVALGLPGSDSVFAHSLIAGWGTGMWADDTWFLQYALSRRFGRARVYGSWRGTLQATSSSDVIDGDRFRQDRTWEQQIGAGMRYSLGSIPVVPDWVVLGATASLLHKGYPSLDLETPQAEGFGVAWAVGGGWSW